MEARLKGRRRKRTSDTDTLRIDWVSASCPEGRIGLTLCPAKKQLDGVFAHWDRDLAKDLSVICDSDVAVRVVEPGRRDHRG